MGFLLDLRYAFRRLAKSPKFTVLTSFILMGGLAVSLMTFNFVFTMAFKPLDTPEGYSIVSPVVSGDYIDDKILARDLAKIDKSLFAELYQEYAFAYSDDGRLSTGEIGMNARVSRVSAGFFELTRFKPVLGREFNEQDQLAQNNNIMAISYRVWQMLFAGNSDVIGQTVMLENRPFEVVAVMPQGYRFPINADLWLPLDNRFWQSPQAEKTVVDILARLDSQLSEKQAGERFADELTRVALAHMSSSEQADFAQLDVTHMSIPERHLKDDAGSIFLVLQGIALAILLMACINTGNLIFARSIERQKESAIRAALGARDFRLVRQLVLEGAILTLVGGILAILLSGWLLDVLNNAMHQNNGAYMPFWFNWQMGWQTMTVALIFMLVTFVFACLLPGIKATKMDINAVLRDGTRGALGRGAGKLSQILVTVQVALIACLMLTGSLGVALMSKMSGLLEEKTLDHRFGVEMALENIEKAEFVHNLLMQLKAKPQIIDTGLKEHQGPFAIRLDGLTLPQPVDVFFSGGNFAMFDIELLQGREIDYHDSVESKRVALVSESFALRHFGDLDSLGKTVDIELDGQFISHSIIGIAKDQIANSMGIFAQANAYDEIYISYYQNPKSEIELTFVTTDEVEQAVEAFYSLLYQLDAKSMVMDFEDRQGSGNTIMGVFKLMTGIILYSGLFALFLALMGVFGVAASSVVMRRQEVGVRRAIGAKDRAIVLLFLKRNMYPLVIGLAVGLSVYTIVCYLFSTLVGNRIEVATYLSIALLTSVTLAVILGLAAYFPTRAAIEKEPFETLRAD